VVVDLPAPRPGSSPPAWPFPDIDWTITGQHLAHRCQLFLIVALGESILVTGASFGQLPLSAATVAAFVVAFAGSVALR
jgi:low temperature requirement protein LtrA